MAADLIDRLQVSIFPVGTGLTGQEPIFAGAEDLELIESRMLDGRIQQLIYRPRAHRRARSAYPSHLTKHQCSVDRAMQVPNLSPYCHDSVLACSSLPAMCWNAWFEMSRRPVPMSGKPG